MKKLLLIICILCQISSQAQLASDMSIRLDTNDYIKDWNTSVSNIGGNYTIECWVKLSKYPISLTHLDLFNNKIFGCYINRTGHVGIIEGFVWSNNSSDNTIPLNQWTHIAITFDTMNNPPNKDTANIYIDGLFDKRIVDDIAMEQRQVNADSIKIGRYMSGEIDELRIWNRILSAQEIRNQFLSSYSAFGNGMNGLIYVQNFENFNQTISLNSGSIVGSASFVQKGNSPSTSFRHNSCLRLDGNNAYRPIIDDDSFTTMKNPLTLELWVKPTSIGNYTMLTRQSPVGVEDLGISMLTSGNVIVHAGNKSILSNSKLLIGRWHHIAVSIDENIAGDAKGILYINGKKDAEVTGISINVSSGRISIGGNPGIAGSSMSGFIDEVRISNFTKSEAEIIQGIHVPTQLFKQPIAPKNTVAYSFDGTLVSATGKGYRLFPLNSAQGAQYNFNTETSAPLFAPYEGISDYKIRTNFTPFHFSSPNPEVIWDSIYIDSNLAIESDQFRFFVALDHDAISNVTLTLFSPKGDSILLMTNPMSFVKNITAIFDTQQSNTINNSLKFSDISPIIGSYQSYAALNGKPSRGWWKLKLIDEGSGKQGQIFSWGVKIKGSPIPETNHLISSQSTSLSTENYPNPFTDELTVTSHRSIDGIEILDMNGKKILNKKYSTKSLKLEWKENLPGIYILKILFSDGSIEMNKIMKQ